MLPEPFALTTDMSLADAVKAAIHRHYPVYPVVDADRHVIGVVRGWRLFERQAIEISAQSGQMVGVDKEERLYTGIWAAFKMTRNSESFVNFGKPILYAISIT